MNHREKTQIRFGAIEAYAKRRLRAAPLADSLITLSLQEPGNERSHASPLLSLEEGSTLSVEMLDAVVPSLGSVIWTFASTSGLYSLTTIADNIEVTLALPATGSDTAFRMEGVLRGIAARIVVAVGYVSQNFE